MLGTSGRWRTFQTHAAALAAQAAARKRCVGCFRTRSILIWLFVKNVVLYGTNRYFLLNRLSHKSAFSANKTGVYAQSCYIQMQPHVRQQAPQNRSVIKALRGSRLKLKLLHRDILRLYSLRVRVSATLTKAHEVFFAAVAAKVVSPERDASYGSRFVVGIQPTHDCAKSFAP